MPEEYQRRVVCAACRNPITKQMLIGPRHFDSTMVNQLSNFSLLLGNADSFTEQGFIDQHGVFMDRTEAYLVAKAAKQIIRDYRANSKTLYSENLY